MAFLRHDAAMANFFSSMVSWLSRLGKKRGVGEKVFSRLLPGLGSYGLPGGWTSDRSEIVRHYKSWSYVAIRAIAEEIAGLAMHAAYVRSAEQAHRRREKGISANRFLGGKILQKTLSNHVQPHEELEMVSSNHPLMRLLANPNGPDTSWTFWYRTALYLELTGNAYWWVIPNSVERNPTPAELWCLPSHWMWPSPIRQPGHLLDWYELRPLGVGISGSLRIPAREIVHFQYPGPLSMFDGWAPMAAGADWVDIGESLDQCRWASFKEGLRPGLIIELDPEMADPSSEDIKRFYARLEERFQGEKRTGRPMILTPGAHVSDDKTRTPEEMMFVQSAEQVRDWNLALHRVSKTIAGITDEVNFATMRAAAANFARWTIKPKLLLLASVATERLAHRFDDDLCLYYDDPTPDDPDQLNRDISTDAANGATTPNEIRQKRGLEPLKDPIADKPVPLALALWQKQGAGGREEEKNPGANPLAGLLGGAATANGKPTLPKTKKAFSRNGGGL